VGDSPLTEENLNDPNDLDGATDTNTAIRYGALDINTTFPNGTLPTILYTANFTVKDGFDGNTSINLVGAADGQFLGVPLTLNLAPIVPDEDTPPVVAAPLSDILVNENDDNTTIDLLPVFSDVDGDAIAYSITSSDESRIVATIEGTNAILDYQPEQFGEDITITVTAEANGKAVSDDFLVDITTTIVDEPEEPPAPEIATLDIDGSGEVTFARDGLLASALLFFYRDDRTDYSILDRFITDPNATLKTGNEIVDLYKNNLSIFDVDGNGEVTFARDGLLVSAFLFFNRPDRTDFSVLDRFITAPDAVRKTGAEVATYLQGLLPIFINAALDSDSGNSIEPSNFIGTDGKDILTGNATNKIFFGGAGDNLLTGSANKDSFQFVANSGDYRVQDLKIGEDLIEIDSVLGFSNSSEVLAAITTKNIADNLFPSELDLEANGTVEILHDRALTADNFVVT
jgi:hypothetical protein